MAYSIRESSPEEILQLTKYGWASPTISDSVAMTGKRGGSGDLISIGKNGNYNYVNNSGGNTKVISEMASDNKFQYLSGGSSGRKLAEGGGSSGGNFGNNSNGSTSYVKFNSDLRSGAAAGGNHNYVGVNQHSSTDYISNNKPDLLRTSSGDLVAIGGDSNSYPNGVKAVNQHSSTDYIANNGYDLLRTSSGDLVAVGGDSNSYPKGTIGVIGGAASSAAGGLGTLKLDLNNVGQFANSIEKCAEQLDNVWKKVQTKDIEVINNSWASEDAQEYVNKLNEEGEKIKYIVSSLKLLSKTYNSIASEGGNAQQDIGRMIRNI